MTTRRCARTTNEGKPCRNKAASGDCGRHTATATTTGTPTTVGAAVAATDPLAAQASTPPADPWDGVSAGDRSYIEAAYTGRPTGDISADVDFFTAEMAAHTPPSADAPWEVKAAQEMVAEDLQMGLRAAQTALRLRHDGHLA